METKYKIMIGAGIGTVLSVGAFYFLSSRNRDSNRIAKSVETAVEEESLYSENIFGDVPYIPKRA